MIWNLFKLALLICCVLAGGCFDKNKDHNEQDIDNKSITVGNIASVEMLDPQIAGGLAEAEILQGLFEGLLIAHPETLQPIPGLAESYTVSPDGLNYKFSIRKGAKWSNGDAITAQNFVDALERGLTPEIGSPWVDMYFVIKNAKQFYNHEVPFSDVGVVAVDDLTLQYTLESPVAYFESLLIHWAWYPVNRNSIEKIGNFFDRNTKWTKVDNLVSNGPFYLKSETIGDRIVIAKNNNYWDADNVDLEKIVFLSCNDTKAEENMFQTGKLDITDSVSPDKIKLLQEQGVLHLSTALGTSYFYINCDKHPFDDVRVRKALSLSINREEIGRLRNRGNGFEAYSLVPPGTLNFESKILFNDDVKLAKQLLSDAGYPDGVGFPKVTLLYNSGGLWKLLSEAAQDMWQKNLGIEIDLQGIEWKVFVGERRSHNFDICRGGWFGDYNDATTFLELFKSIGNNNHTSFKNKEFDWLLVQASQESDTKERQKLLENAEKILIDNMPIIPLYYESTGHVVSKRISGWYPNILDWHLWKFVKVI